MRFNRLEMARMKIKTSSVTPHKALTTIITRVCIPQRITPHTHNPQRRRLYRSAGIFQSIEENPCCFWD
jgi:hypothetical protein